MNFIDIILIIPIIWFIYRGYKKGFIIEIASLVALLLGIYAAIHFSGNVTSFLDSFIDLEKKYLDIISFTLIFIAVIIIVMLIARLLEKIIKVVMLGFLNRIIGAVFGLIKIIVILSFLLLIINVFDDKEKLISKENKQNSMLYEAVASIAPMIISFFQTEKQNLPDINITEI